MNKKNPFSVVNGGALPETDEKATREKIETLIKDNRVVIFMKGVPDAPYCGFSATASGILSSHGVEYLGIDVLGQPEYREAIKSYTQWPTIPQVFIDGEFVGGCDIIVEMNQTGELEKLLKA